MSTKTRALTRVLLRDDLRDWSTLIFTFIFHRDSGKWGGPLETAIQDIVGSFAMVILSYHLLVLFGPAEVKPWDVCGAHDLS